MSDYMKAAVKLLEEVFLDGEESTGVQIEGRTFRECQDVIRGLRTELAEHEELRENVEYILSKEDSAISCGEGGEPGSLSASLAVTWAKKNKALADKERQLQESWSVRSDLDELAERDEQEPVGEVDRVDAHPEDPDGKLTSMAFLYPDFEELPYKTKLYLHPPAPAAVPDWHAITQAVEEMVDHYEYRGGEGDYTPTETERVLIQDAAMEVLDTIAPMLQSAEPASRHLDNTGQDVMRRTLERSATIVETTSRSESVCYQCKGRGITPLSSDPDVIGAATCGVCGGTGKPIARLRGEGEDS